MTQYLLSPTSASVAKCPFTYLVSGFSAALLVAEELAKGRRNRAVLTCTFGRNLAFSHDLESYVAPYLSKLMKSSFRGCSRSLRLG